MDFRMLYLTKHKRNLLIVLLLHSYDCMNTELSLRLLCQENIFSLFLNFVFGLLFLFTVTDTFENEIHNACSGIVTNTCNIFRASKVRESSTSLCISTYQLPTFFTHLIEHCCLIAEHKRTEVLSILCFFASYFNDLILPCFRLVVA